MTATRTRPPARAFATSRRVLPSREMNDPPSHPGAPRQVKGSVTHVSGSGPPRFRRTSVTRSTTIMSAGEPAYLAWDEAPIPR